MARPKKQISEKLVEDLAGIGCTIPEIAKVAGCSESTIKRRFAPILEKGRAKLKTSIRRHQIQVAEKGNVSMLIWLGKNYLGQADSPPPTDVPDNSRVRMPEQIAQAMDQTVPSKPKQEGDTDADQGQSK